MRFFLVIMFLIFYLPGKNKPAPLVYAVTDHNNHHSMDQNTSPYSVKIRFNSFLSGNPPTVHFVTTIFLENNSDSLKWFVFPDGMELSLPDNGKLSVKSLLIKKYINNGSAFVYSFGSNKNGVAAFPLPAHSQMEIKGFSFLAKNDNVKSLAADVIVANEIQIDHLSLKNWLTEELFVSDKKVTFQYDLFKGEKIMYKKTNDGLDVPFQLEVAKKFHLNISGEKSTN